MAVRISRLAILLGVDQKGLSTGLKKGEAEVKGFVGRLQRSFSSLQNLATFAPVAASIGIFTQAVRDFISVGDRFDKLAGRTGISATALQEFAFVAERSGTSIEAFETAIRTLADRVEQFRDGTGEASEAFQRLGVSFETLEALTVEQRLVAVFDALSKVEDAGQKAALAQDIFGRAGTQLLPVLNDGADGVEALRSRFRELGGGISEDGTKQAAKLADAMTDLTTAFKSFSVALAEDVVPELLSSIELLTEFLRLTREIRKFSTGLGLKNTGSALTGGAKSFRGFGPNLALDLFDSIAAGFTPAINPTVITPGRLTVPETGPPPANFAALTDSVKQFGTTAFDAFTEPFKRLPDTAKGIAKEFAAGFADAFDGFQKVQAVRQQFAFDQFVKQISATLGGPDGVSFGQAGAVRAGTVEAAQIQLDAQTRNAELQASQQIIKETQTTNRILGEIAARQILDSPAVLALASIPGA